MHNNAKTTIRVIKILVMTNFVFCLALLILTQERYGIHISRLGGVSSPNEALGDALQLSVVIWLWVAPILSIATLALERYSPSAWTPVKRVSWAILILWIGGILCKTFLNRLMEFNVLKFL